MNFEIRVPEIGELGGVRDLINLVIDEGQAFRRAPGEYGSQSSGEFISQHREFFRNPNNILLVAISEQNVIGFVRFFQNTERRRVRHTGYMGIGVHPNFRGKKVGTQLIEALLRGLDDTSIERVSLYVFSNNERAIALYEKLGFQKSGVFPKEIKLDEGEYRDLLLMNRWI